MSTKAKTFITRLLFTTILLYLIMPIVSRTISTFLTTYFYLLLLLVTVASIVFAKGMITVNKYFFLLLPFILWRLLLLLILKPSLIEWGYESIVELTPILIGYVIVYRMNWKNQKYFSIVLIAAFAITATTTVIGLQFFPEASRYLATVASSDEPEFVLYNWINLAGYEFAYSIVLCYPILIYAFKMRKIPRVAMILSVLFLFYFVLSSGYTTALLLFLISTLFLVFKKDLTIKQIVIFLIVLAIIAIVLFPLLSAFFHFLSNKVPNEMMAERLEVLANGREGFEKTDDRRLDLYWMSISSFFKHPIFGGFFTEEAENGGHSFLLDSLAQLGLLGLILLIWMYRKIYQIFYRPYKKNIGYGYIFWMFLQTLILSLVNTEMWIFVLCLYIPILLKLINQVEEVN